MNLYSVLYKPLISKVLNVATVASRDMCKLALDLISGLWLLRMVQFKGHEQTPDY